MAANTLFETYQMLWSQATLIYGVLWLQNNYSYKSHLDSCHLAFAKDTGAVRVSDATPTDPGQTLTGPRSVQDGNYC